LPIYNLDLKENDMLREYECVKGKEKEKPELEY